MYNARYAGRFYATIMKINLLYKIDAKNKFGIDLMRIGGVFSLKTMYEN